MVHPKRKRSRQALTMLLVLLALGLRVFYTPVHLAQEAHFGPAQHSDAHALVHGAHDSHPHRGDGDHDHDGDHPSHPALDHAFELLARRASPTWVALDLTPAPLGQGWSPTAPRAWFTTNRPDLRPPRPLPGTVHPPRGPPAAA